MKKIYYILFLLALAGCDSFLDKMPDNRTEIDNQQKIRALLTSAYPATDYMLLTEFMSDNFRYLYLWRARYGGRYRRHDQEG